MRLITCESINNVHLFIRTLMSGGRSNKRDESCKMGLKGRFADYWRRRPPARIGSNARVGSAGLGEAAVVGVDERRSGAALGVVYAAQRDESVVDFLPRPVLPEHQSRCTQPNAVADRRRWSGQVQSIFRTITWTRSIGYNDGRV